MLLQVNKKHGGETWLVLKPWRLHLVRIVRWNVGGCSRHSNETQLGNLQVSSIMCAFSPQQPQMQPETCNYRILFNVLYIPLNHQNLIESWNCCIGSVPKVI
ncbi:Hypothetical predicted protein [Podarcis lilfordi]|uniref:Uncharacterized protein n=1 Tax=Podarcis lilfordi TaxID=74358 RepID=A0AA35LHF9_9SAUR|nr:Hypothetical predicted protein [Podarcis lilfordi]